VITLIAVWKLSSLSLSLYLSLSLSLLSFSSISVWKLSFKSLRSCKGEAEPTLSRKMIFRLV
jgi:hypothetical protein